MTDETFLAKARRKTITTPTQRELLHTMAKAADAGAPWGTTAHWARQAQIDPVLTAKALERLGAAGLTAKQWDASNYVWNYQVRL